MIGLALDVDGTIVGNDGFVFEEVGNALRRQWHKLTVVLTSARPAAGVEYILQQIGRMAPMWAKPNVPDTRGKVEGEDNAENAAFALNVLRKLMGASSSVSST